MLGRSSPISYYTNVSATQLILLGGDIEMNQGTTSTTNSGSTPRSDKKKTVTKQQWNKTPQFVQFAKRLCA